MMELFHFGALFLLTNVVFGAIVSAFLLGRNHRLRMPDWPLVITGFAFGPFLTTLVLYYTLALWHGVPAWVARVLPVVVFMVLAFRAGAGWSRLWGLFRALPARLLHDRSLWFYLLGSGFLLVVAVLFLVNKPLADHDVLEYALQGRVFQRDMAITYQRHPFDEATGFYYVGLHGHSFPLLFTWEGLHAQALSIRSDLWGRSITMWYGWLLITFVWALLRRVDRWAAVWGGIALTAPLGFLFLLTIYHLDGYRILFFCVSLAAFVHLLRTPSLPGLLLFAALCGAHAFIHSTGAILSGVLWLVMLACVPLPTTQRLRWGALAAGVMLAFGAVHYVVDILFGTGWILQDIIWF
jgi:hypothetical protein